MKRTLLVVAGTLLAGVAASLTNAATPPAAPAPAAAPSGAAPTAEPTAAQAKFFETKVRPLLVEHCYSCHGEKKQKGRLRLDSLAAALKGGDSGPAIIPGDVAKSPIMVAVHYKDEDLQMPPDEKLADAQIQILSDWVAMGAPWPKDSGDGAIAPAPQGKKRVITDENRQFWSFQPVKLPAVPAVADAWVKNDVDKFVLAKLKAEGLTPAPAADKVTLIRRATFDLHGLPPTPEEVSAFVADQSSDAYEKLIDRLLASPRYGERYGRHWLDLARYAESDGFRQDAYRANAWHYRDWVIASFNADLPYDQFVKLQIAGDEIAPNDPAARVATGFLRHGMYEYNAKDAETQRFEFLTDVTDVTADAFIGLSMGCARCHDHKFDPILQADYFRLMAFFAPVQPRNDLPLAATPDALAAYRAELAKWEAKTKSIRDQIDAIEAPARKSIEKTMVGRFPPVVQDMMAKPPAERTPYEKQIAYLVYRQVDDDLKKLDDKIKGPAKDKLVQLRIELSKFDDEKPKALPIALCVTDVGPAAPPTVIPGDATKTAIAPGYPVVLDHLNLPQTPITASASTTGRRTALADWLTNPANPLTTRVIANRVWQWHFGHGIVRTSSDYGVLGEPPSHPELLDYLTAKLVENKWGLKAMHKLVMTSATYRQAGVRAMPEAARLKDPENRWYWRMNPRRLEAEQIRDSMLAVSGELQLDVTSGPPADYTAPKRTIFTKLVRNTRDPLLDVFDLPEAFGSVADRNATTTSTQSLLMVNGDWPLKRAAAFAARVAKETKGSDAGARVDAAYDLAFNRKPTADERSAAVEFLNQKRANPTVAVAAVTPEPGAATAADTAGATGDVNDMPITQVMPQTGGQAVLVRDAAAVDMLKMPRADKPLFGDRFTVEGYVMLESLYESANVRVIASQWNGDQKKVGWSLGVTSEKSQFQPRNLILQLVGDAADGSKKGGYEVVASNLRLELHKVYYVGASVDLADTSEKGITFWVKDVGDMDAPLRVANVRHTVTGAVTTGTSPLILGGREPNGAAAAHGWDGLIGEVRISNAAIKADQNLWNEGDPKGAVVGHWKFEETPGFLKEVSARLPDLARGKGTGKTTKATGGATPAAKSQVTPAAPPAKVDAALIDFCHVLLNSNEFLYVD